jgi:hypothetical protein
MDKEYAQLSTGAFRRNTASANSPSPALAGEYSPSRKPIAP